MSEQFTKVPSLSGSSELPQPATLASNKDSSNRRPSRATQVKSDITKLFLEQHFQNVLRESSECKQRHRQFKEILQQSDMSKKEKKNLESEFARGESNIKRIRRRNLRVTQFEKIKLIGRGAFGDVYVVRDKEDKEIYAMKILRKNELIAKGQIINTLAERDFLTQSDNPWSVQLYYSFSDSRNLYLVMEFLPGGDLMNLLIKRGILTETETRFFIAETLLAIHNVHKTGFIHRDIKPDNLLLTTDGHIRLTDFGLSTKMERYSDPLVQLIDELTDVMQNKDEPLQERTTREKKRRDQVCSTVGTPDYIAPEVLLKHPYTNKVDFWSLGAIMYEMLFGSPPFLADTNRGTALRIIRWSEALKFPNVPPVSREAIDLIKKLLCNPEDRLDFEGIKAHPFFAGIDWDNLMNTQSPCIPVVNSKMDTQNFDEFEERMDDDNCFGQNDEDEIANLAFMGFQFNKKANNMPSQEMETIKSGQFLQQKAEKEKHKHKDKKKKK
ncbi:AGC family protein kinase [Histomonas meleagridis]|uniref:AGC family protein kinase n=1 Tax=Histomonas meleagridis TaxID=135588 RepID=UPI00355A7DFC|nr:AGC family protein kinase [Histomonas meleagridis]KAH0803379.1 AGC family protein kinase [Histomonas meleagridis]